jgi:hypothetical protein
MPPQRKPLGPVSGNRLLGQHLSPYARGKIAGKAEEGATPASIAKELELEYSTVYRTIQTTSYATKASPFLERLERNHIPNTTNASSFAIYEQTRRIPTGRS